MSIFLLYELVRLNFLKEITFTFRTLSNERLVIYRISTSLCLDQSWNLTLPYNYGQIAPVIKKYYLN